MDQPACPRGYLLVPSDEGDPQTISEGNVNGIGSPKPEARRELGCMDHQASIRLEHHDVRPPEELPGASKAELGQSRDSCDRPCDLGQGEGWDHEAPSCDSLGKPCPADRVKAV